MREKENLTLLGNRSVPYTFDYDPTLLETFVNKHPQNDYFVKFNCPEFTSLCPITGQPDFATVYISYIPNERMVESKSLKLYLFSFRNHGDFHEDCVNIIMKDLIKLMEPKYIEVWGISRFGESFCRAAVSPSTPTATTACRAPNTNSSRGTVSPITTSTPNPSATAKPLPRWAARLWIVEWLGNVHQRRVRSRLEFIIAMVDRH